MNNLIGNEFYRFHEMLSGLVKTCGIKDCKEPKGKFHIFIAKNLINETDTPLVNFLSNFYPTKKDTPENFLKLLPCNSHTNDLINIAKNSGFSIKRETKQDKESIIITTEEQEAENDDDNDEYDLCAIKNCGKAADILLMIENPKKIEETELLDLLDKKNFTEGSVKLYKLSDSEDPDLNKEVAEFSSCNEDAAVIESKAEISGFNIAYTRDNENNPVIYINRVEESRITEVPD